MTQITMKALLETGVHFGHRTRKWNPKMDDFIFTERNGIHILDLQQTLKALKEAYELVRDSVAEGGTVLFVGTKRQAQETIARESTRCRMPYVNERWLGGTLTNWRTIRQRIDYLKDLERRRDEGEFELLTKKEALTLEREIEKLNIRLGGIREMKGLPEIVFVVDVTREHTAVHEANILNIPIVAMVDTNGDPDLIDYVVPANDDAIRAIKLIAGVMADAVIEGMAVRKEGFEEEDVSYEEYGVYDFEDDEDDEELLGESTLAKLKSSELSFEEDKGKNGGQKAKASATEEEPEEEADEPEEELEDEVEGDEEDESEESAEDEEAEAEDEE